MSICNRCERFFVYKNSLRRHQQKRRRPCRPAVASCVQCGNKFTSFDSLKKHKKLYCKAEEEHNHQEQKHLQKIDLQDFLNQLPSSSSPSNNNNNHDDDDDARNHQQLYTSQSVAEFTPSPPPNTYFHNDSLQELLDQINFSPMMTNNDNDNIIIADEEEEGECKAANIHAHDNDIVNVVVVDDNDNEEKLQRQEDGQEVLNHFDSILTSWLYEIQRLEDTCKSHSIVKDKILESLYRMLQDGLLSTIEYNDLVYTSNLFIKLHDLITVYLPAIHKRSVIDILIELYEMKKITRAVFIEMCVNL